MKKVLHTSAATGWLVVATAVLIGGLFFEARVGAQEAQEPGRPAYFTLENRKTVQGIDREALEDEFQFGTATIKLQLDATGKQVPVIHDDAVRRGPQAFAEKLVAIMRDWRYTPGFEGPMYVTVAIPGPSELAEGKIASISVDLKEVRILDPKKATISRHKEHQLQLVKHAGFLGNVYLTGAPVAVVDAYETKTMPQLIAEVWSHLGTFFQWLFVVLFGILVYALVRTFFAVRRSWVNKGLRIGKDLFESEDARKVEESWIRAIKHSQLGTELFEGEHALDLELLRKARAEMEQAEDFDTATAVAQRYQLVEVMGTDLLYNENGNGVSSLAKMKERFKAKLRAEDRTEKWKQERLRKIEKCATEEELLSLAEEEGYLPEQITGSVKREPRSVSEIKKRVGYVVETLERIEEDLCQNTNGGNGKALRNNGLSEKQEKKYEKFLWEHLGKPKVKEALRVCYRYDKVPLFEIYESGLRNHLVNRNEWWASQEIDRSVDRTTQVKIEARRGPLDWLWAIGSLSPMFGLFGTVWGISQAFGKIRGITDTRLLMQNLAGDINIALATTIVGLVLGVLAFITYYYAKYFLDRDATKIEQYFTDITNRA